MNDKLLKVTEKIIGSEELSEKLKNMKSLDEIVRFYQSLDGSIAQKDILDYLHEVLGCYKKIDDNSLEQVVGGKVTPKNRVLASVLGALTVMAATPLASNTYATTGNTNAGTLSTGQKVLAGLGTLAAMAITTSPFWIPAAIEKSREKEEKKKEKENDREWAECLLPRAVALLESCKIARDIWPGDERYKDEIVGLQETIRQHNKTLKLDKNPILKKEIELKTTDEILLAYKNVFSIYLLGWEQMQQLKDFGNYVRVNDLFDNPSFVLGMDWESYDQIGEVLRRLYEIIEQRANAGMINDKTEISKEKLESDANALKQKLIDKCNIYRRRSIENQNTN